MSRVNFTQIHTGISAVDRVQTNLAKTLRPILQNPMVDGVHKRGVSLSTTAADIEHGLGRRPEGFVITKQDAAASIYEPSESTLPTRLITLQASASVTADIFFF